MNIENTTINEMARIKCGRHNRSNLTVLCTVPTLRLVKLIHSSLQPLKMRQHERHFRNLPAPGARFMLCKSCNFCSVQLRSDVRSNLLIKFHVPTPSRGKSVSYKTEK